MGDRQRSAAIFEDNPLKTPTSNQAELVKALGGAPSLKRTPLMFYRLNDIGF